MKKHLLLVLQVRMVPTLQNSFWKRDMKFMVLFDVFQFLIQHELII